MIDFKRFIFAYIIITVLFSATSQAMFGPGHGFNDDDMQAEQDLVTGFNAFRLDDAAQPFFGRMKLRGYITLQLINDCLSPMTISIKLTGTDQILSSTPLNSGRYHDVFIPQDTSFDLVAVRNNIPHARPMVLTFIANGQDIATRISRWNVGKWVNNLQAQTHQPANLFNVQPDPEHSLLD